jgi:hypothetical protein
MIAAGAVGGLDGGLKVEVVETVVAEFGQGSALRF